MAFEITPHTVLLDQKKEVLATAGELIKLVTAVDQASVRRVMLDAVSTHWRSRLRRDLEAALMDVVSTYEMIEGEASEATDLPAWYAGLDASVKLELAAIGALLPDQAFNDAIVGEAVARVDTVGDVAFELARLLVEQKLPLPMNTGKWLSAIGIAKVEMDWLTTQIPAQTVNQAMQTPVAPPAYTITDQTVRTDLPPIAVPPAPPGALVAATTDFVEPDEDFSAPSLLPVPPAPIGAPDKAAVARAYKLIYDDGSMDVDDTAKALIVSRGTMMNYLTGRTQAKCTFKQAQFLRADTDRRIVALQEAASIFAAVRD